VIPRIARTAAVIENTLGKTDLADVAAKLSIAVKTMERDFHRGIGLSPKEFARIIRFNKVLNSLNSGPRMNIHDLVYQCGYYDQSHLINEFREFTGTTPSALVRRDPASEEPEGGVHQSFRERVRI
jgi:methylphosphotriester-DNA--protein-cysteine methyltransferase